MDFINSDSFDLLEIHSKGDIFYLSKDNDKIIAKNLDVSNQLYLLINNLNTLLNYKSNFSESANNALIRAIDTYKTFLCDIGVHSITRNDFEDFERIYTDHKNVNKYVTYKQMNVIYDYECDMHNIEFSYLPYYINETKNERLISKGEIKVSIPCLTRKKKTN